MIRIQDNSFKKQALGGAVLLDRAAVVVMGVDLRGTFSEDLRGGSPGIRCDIAYGIEDGQGKFRPFDYNSLETTVPFYVQPQEFEQYQRGAVTAMTGLNGQHLLEALTLWFETELVARGKFGPGATVA